MTKILDGKKIRDELTDFLKKGVGDLDERPTLLIIQVGNSEESEMYINEKKDYGEKIGVIVEHRKYSEDISEESLMSDIQEFNLDQAINGIIVQLPIPSRLNKNLIIDKIDPRKDVDGLTSENISLLVHNKERVIPATTKGIITLLENQDITIKGSKVVVVGESFLVGRPTALAFINRGATVTVCHVDTKGLEEETKQADILITATGKDGLITSRHVSGPQVIIDVGIKLKEGRVYGDVKYNEVKDVVSAITPVPGGVGPMTVLSLFENLLTVIKEQ